MRLARTLKTTLVSAFLFLTHAVIAADFDVTPTGNYLAEYKGKYVIILKTFEQSTAPLPERLEQYEQAMNQLKEEFRNKRKQEYSKIAVNRSVSNSCTSKSSGGKKDCGWNGVTIENENMYTRPEWITVAGDSKGTRVSPDGRTASLKMTVAGKGKNKGTLTTRFVYHPDKIQILSEKDTAELFKQIVSK